MGMVQQVTASLLQPVVGLYTDRRPDAVCARRRHGDHRSSACCGCRRRAPSRCCSAAAGLMGIGSAMFHPEASRVARHGVGRTPRPRAVALPGGRQRRILAGAARRGVPDRSARPDAASRGARCWRCWGWRSSGESADGTRRGRPRRRSSSRATSRSNRAAASSRRARRLAAGDSRGADLFEVLLSRQPEQLLHLFPDQQVRRLGAHRANRPVHLSRRRRGGHGARRADRGSVRPEVRHLGLDLRRAAVHAGAAVREPVLDADPDGDDRSRAGVGLLRDRGVCAGARAGPGRA